ncbi:MAG: hypothetical protein KAX45_07470 [Chitinophagaceae bacterium]|nr:hypothetical protein [Chitinophagaceae bacterium]MBP6590201.1 hypothetical protein [Chitinophagaceae bacterium]MBP8244361.1 hypothetical protein [Chitinophagaceae bacterium]
MRQFLFLVILLASLSASSQISRDTVLSRCPVYITDTVSVNNFFLEARPATLKVYRVKGDLTVVVEQRDQFFSLFFHEKKLRNTTFDIEPGSKGRGEVEAAYSFKSGDQTALISLSDGKIESSFDKDKKMWKLKVNGTITNMSDRTLSYYRVRTELWLK